MSDAFSVDSGQLLAAARIAETFRDELFLAVDKTGLVLSGVDPAHVAWFRLRLPLARADDISIHVPIDVEKVRTFLQAADREGISGMSRVSVYSDNRIAIQVGSAIYRMMAVKAAKEDNLGETKRPQAANQNLTGRFVPRRLQSLLALAQYASDHVRLHVNKGPVVPTQVQVLAAGDDTVDGTLALDDAAWVVKNDEAASSSFPLDYLSNVVKAIVASGAEQAQLYLGLDYPLRLTWQFASVGEAEAMVAPRIDTEDG